MSDWNCSENWYFCHLSTPRTRGPLCFHPRGRYNTCFTMSCPNTQTHLAHDLAISPQSLLGLIECSLLAQRHHRGAITPTDSFKLGLELRRRTWGSLWQPTDSPFTLHQPLWFSRSTISPLEMMISVRKNNKECIRYRTDVTVLSSAQEICLAACARLLLANLRLFGASWRVECRAFSSFVVSLQFFSFFVACHIFWLDPQGQGFLLLYNTTEKVEKGGNSDLRLHILDTFKRGLVFESFGVFVWPFSGHF